MAVSEPDLLWLNANRDALTGIRLLIPAERQLRLVLDKDQVCHLADGVGIPTPQSVQPESFADVEQAARTFEYPMVLKWARPYDVMSALRKAGLTLLKVDYCYGPEEVLERLRPFARANIYPMIQSYCAGVGLGHMILMHEGEPLLLFRHLRIREWPPEGGFSTICESLPLDPEDPLLARSIRLLQAINWEGPAMVEYRYDRRTGRAALMEINGRFWGSLPLAFHAGAHFAWGTLSALGLGRTELPSAYRAGVRCVSMAPELKRLARVLFTPEKIQVRELRFQRRGEIRLLLSLLLSPRTRYFVFWPRDPFPALVDFAGMAVSAVGKLWAALTAKRPRERRRRRGDGDTKAPASE